MWLSVKGALMSFRLGADGTLTGTRELEALEAKVLAASNRSDELAARLLAESRALYPPTNPPKRSRELSRS
jgi:hypothetical protein